MRRSEVGQDRRLGRASQAPPGRPWVSVRPERVCHCELAGRGQASGEKSPGAKSPEERTRVLKRRGGASKGVAVASISRRSGKQAAAITKVRLSALRLPSKRG